MTAFATAALAATLSLAPATASASAHLHAAHPPVPSGTARQRPARLPSPPVVTPGPGLSAPLTTLLIYDTCDAGNNLCMRDPSDGGNGTEVVTSDRSGSNAEDWIFFVDYDRCPGGLVSSTCPGGLISQEYQNKTIVVISNYGAAGGTYNDCIKANAASGWHAVIGSCDTGPGGNGEISTAFVDQTNCSSPGLFCLVSIKYALDHNVINWLTSYVNPNLDLYVGNNGFYSNWTAPSS